MRNNAYVMGCLLCGKPYEQVIEERVAEYLHQTAEPADSVRDRVSKRNSLQGGVFTFVRREVSQAAACECQIYAVYYNKPQPSAQKNPLPLFADWKHHKIQLNANAGQIPALICRIHYTYI